MMENEIKVFKGEVPNNLKMLSDISFSKELRRLQDKTQMFNTRLSEHFRTRLTHTLEVVSISERIVEGLNDIFLKNGMEKLDINLVKSIAYAHDLGHTPYGHVGEEKINELLIEDNLFFKHNINSAKILLDPRVIKSKSDTNEIKKFGFNIQNYDWRLIDGVIKHTKAYPNVFGNEIIEDPYNLNVYLDNHPVWKEENFKSIINKFTSEYKSLFFENEKIRTKNVFIHNYLNYPAALSLEGQVVALADEIAQRISDFDDGIRLFYKLESECYKKSFKDLIVSLETYRNKLNNIKESITTNDNANKKKKNKKINEIIEIQNKKYRITNIDICDYDGERTSYFLGSTINFCDVIITNLNKIIGEIRNRSIYQYKLYVKIAETSINDLIKYVSHLIENKQFSYQILNIAYSKKKRTSGIDELEYISYKLFHPHYKDNLYKPMISFPKILENMMDILKTNRNFFIKDSVIAKSNSDGIENINRLFMIYNEDVKRVDNNTKRLIKNRLKEKYPDIDSNKIYEIYNKNGDSSLVPVIKQVILEGIARMTDTYVEKILANFEGYKYYNHNINNEV